MTIETKLSIFKGFSNTIHGGFIDDALNIDDDYDYDNDKTDYKATFIKYSKSYVELISRETKIDLQMNVLESPKYYNFENDKIFVNCKDIVNIKEKVLKEFYPEFKQHLLDNFSSYEGFHSFYTNDPEEFVELPVNNVTNGVYLEILINSLIEEEALHDELSEIAYNSIVLETDKEVQNVI